MNGTAKMRPQFYRVWHLAVARISVGAWVCVCTLAVSVFGSSEPAAPTNGTVAAKSETGPREPQAAHGMVPFSEFKLVSERNIFNGSRAARSSRPAERRRSTATETFTLVGTLSSAAAEIAFFDGSESGFRKAVKLRQTMAGYTVKEIQRDRVKLEKDEETVELLMGASMRREDNGLWRLRQPEAGSAAAASAAGASPSTGADSSGDDDEVLRKLLEKRAQELEK